MRGKCTYAVKAREKYEQNRDKNGLINTVWIKAKQYAKKLRVVEKSTQAILELAGQKNKNSWIDGKSILLKAGINGYKQNKSYGLWPWLENTGAGIIQEQGEFPNSSYRISSEFWDNFNEIINK